jgi:hypothetical protein
MSDEQFAEAAAKFRRRQALVTFGFGTACLAQLANQALGDGTTLGLISGLGFGFCSLLSAFEWRRGMKDTRPEHQRGR